MSTTRPEALLTEGQLGALIFVLSAGYCILIIIFDSIKNSKFVLSKNALRHLLDGSTFATGITVGLAILEPRIFTLVASNGVYVTTLSLTCILGPLINLAERYGRVIEI